MLTHPPEKYKKQKGSKLLIKWENFLGFMAFIISTEQQIPQTKNKERRATCYSEKKKRHIIKTYLVVNNSSLIIHKVCHEKESGYDYDICKNNHPVTPKMLYMYLILDVGVENDFL